MKNPLQLKQVKQQTFAIDSELSLQELGYINGNGPSSWILSKWREWIFDESSEVLDGLCSLSACSGETVDQENDMSCPTYETCCSTSTKSKSNSTTQSKKSRRD